MSACHLSGFFCDDIRQEAGGKLSFMGVYAQKMLLPKFPARLMKLCVHIDFCGPMGEFPNSVTFYMMNGEQELAHVTIEAGRGPSPEEHSFTMRAGLTAAGVEFKEPVNLRLVADADGKKYIGPQLEVCLAPAAPSKH